jgi:hypothetical protein
LKQGVDLPTSMQRRPLPHPTAGSAFPDGLQALPFERQRVQLASAKSLGWQEGKAHG